MSNLNIIPTSDIIDHRKHVTFKNNSTWIFSSAATQHCPLLCFTDSKLPLITPKYIDLLITYIRIFNYITIIPPNCGKNHLEYIGTIYLSIFTIHLCRITVFLILKEIGSLKRNESYLLHCFWQERKWITRSYIYI